MKIWVNKAKSFEAAEEFDNAYYRKMGYKKRLGTVQILREMWRNIRRSNEDGKRLRRTVRVIKQK